MKRIKSASTLILSFALLVCIGYIIELKTEPAFNKNSAAMQAAVVTPSATAPPEPTPTASASTYKTNINTADFDELCKLKGIGEVTAQRIIDYRNEYGVFTAIEDLLFITGIGEKTLEQFKNSICIE